MPDTPQDPEPAVHVPDTPQDPEPAVHVFDQTNGVLDEDDEPERPVRHDTSPKFGIPPLTSL